MVTSSSSFSSTTAHPSSHVSAAQEVKYIYEKMTAVWQTLEQANAGHVPSMFNVGIKYMVGGEFDQDFELARMWFQQAANRQFAPALTNLGYLHVTGKGTPKDVQKACDCFLEAADLKEPVAMYNMGVLYQKGALVTKDPKLSLQWSETARQWYEKAAQLGHVKAQAKVKTSSTH
jgi:TPR repeat protein